MAEGVSDPEATFHDLFSGHAADYARYRPSYPDALYRHVAAALTRSELAWDCATGNGQAALALTSHVARVVATDASAEQLEHATPHPQVSFQQARAEASGLTAESVDLITVAAAAHWFDLGAFYREVRRVARPKAVVALWTYRPHVRVSPELEALVDELAGERLGPYWAAPISRYVESGYATLPFPFEELPSPELSCRVTWPLEGLLAHIRTWSAVQTAWRTTGDDPVAEMADAFARAWGEPAQAREVRFPLHLRLGRV